MSALLEGGYIGSELEAFHQWTKQNFHYNFPDLFCPRRRQLHTSTYNCRNVSQFAEVAADLTNGIFDSPRPDKDWLEVFSDHLLKIWFWQHEERLQTLPDLWLQESRAWPVSLVSLYPEGQGGLVSVSWQCDLPSVEKRIQLGSFLLSFNLLPVTDGTQCNKTVNPWRQRN